jgi:hypothetical protein
MADDILKVKALLQMWVVKRRFRMMKKSTGLIQRYLKGRLARKRVINLLRDKSD